MRTIAICNLKGGVGKTTVTFSLAAGLAELGHTVLAIDADPQGSLSDCLGDGPVVGRPSLAEVLRGQATVATAATATSLERVWLLPASPQLDQINRRNLAGERVLLARMADACDYTLIDCPASPGVVMANALVAADEVLAPVQAKGMALAGIERLLALLGETRKRGANPGLDLVGILVNHFDERTIIARQVLGELRERYGALVFDAFLHESVRLAESVDAHSPVTRHAPGSRAATEVRAVARELVQRTGARRGYFGAPGRAASSSLAAAEPRPLRPYVVGR